MSVNADTWVDLRCRLEANGDKIKAVCAVIDPTARATDAASSPAPPQPTDPTLPSWQITLPSAESLINLVTAVTDMRGYTWITAATLVVALAVADRTGVIPLTMSRRLQQRFATLEQIDRELLRLKLIVDGLSDAEMSETVSIVTTPNPATTVLSYGNLREGYIRAVTRASNLKVKIDSGNMLRNIKENFPRLTGCRTWCEMLDLLDQGIAELRDRIQQSTGVYSQMKTTPIDNKLQEEKEFVEKRKAEEESLPLVVLSEADFDCGPMDEYEDWARPDDFPDF